MSGYDSAARKMRAMNRTTTTAVAFALAGAYGACGTNNADQTSSVPTQATTGMSTTAPTGGTHTTTAGSSTAPRAGSIATGAAGMTVTARAGTAAAPAAGTTVAGTAGTTAAGAGEASAAGAVGAVGAVGTEGTTAVPTAGATAAPTAGGPPSGEDAPELPLEPTNVDVTNNIKRRFGAPHVAVNPKNPNNIVVLASSNLGYTRACLPAAPGSDCEIIPAGNPFLTQPRGFYKTPGFMDIGVFVSNDRGKTFKYVDTSSLVPPDDPKVNARGEGPIAVTMDGTYYIGFNAINWGEWESNPVTFFPNGGVGVIKSTDGGLTWSWTSYSHTPADWPYGGLDPNTGTLYVTSGLAGLSTLGPRSTGMADSPEGRISDRWISSSPDGVTWTDPQPLGAGTEANHVSGGHSSVAAAHGIMATMFVATDQASCSTFLGSMAPSSCVVFQASTDGGKAWSRHRVPTPAGFSANALGILIGADSTKEGHFMAVLLNNNGSNLLVFQTPDSGNTWSEPVKLTEDAAKTHFAPWVASSPNGEFGVMWRTYERDSAKPTASAPYMPYSVWAVVSKDGGATFSQPLKVSKANSPAPPDDPNDSFSFVGDHGPSGMALDDRGGAYVVWADWTPGERAIFLSAINVKAFKF